ncbi:MAG: hypothetical protein ABW091_11165 [Microbacterium sp.]
MGTLFYDGAEFEMEDRLLAHLQVIISLKLRRSESFFLSWVHPHGDAGRHAVWVGEGVPIRFQFAGSRLPLINRDWAETMALAANSSQGLVITDEILVPEADTGDGRV